MWSAARRSTRSIPTICQVLKWQYQLYQMEGLQPTAFLRALILPLAVMGPLLNSTQLRSVLLQGQAASAWLSTDLLELVCCTCKQHAQHILPAQLQVPVQTLAAPPGSGCPC